jgi:hypothetical protein
LYTKNNTSTRSKCDGLRKERKKVNGQICTEQKDCEISHRFKKS